MWGSSLAYKAACQWKSMTIEQIKRRLAGTGFECFAPFSPPRPLSIGIFLIRKTQEELERELWRRTERDEQIVGPALATFPFLGRPHPHPCNAMYDRQLGK